MAFKTPITILKVLDQIDRNEYVLPAIQREFVWTPDKMSRLFDSLMQGYPIGSFLYWKVTPDNTKAYVFYSFMRKYHESKAYRCVRHNVPHGAAVTAILDGQQRFTSLYIGLKGSYAEKLPRKRWENPDAFPETRLFLNLGGKAQQNELGLVFDFRFLTESRAGELSCDGNHFFAVSDILDMEPGPGIFDYLQEAKLTGTKEPFRTLDRLHAIVHRDPIINYFEEESQDLDKVLNIFIRVNSGGTVLSYSDLLLSIATAQWKELDAREAVHELVDALNATHQGFAFSQDVVLKAGLVLTDVSSIGFKVTNFSSTNMATLEKGWSAIGKALKLAARLLGDFGLNAQSLAADSVLIPIAYYTHLRGLKESYLNAQSSREDREVLRGWVIRSLLKPGIWGSGLDTLLGEIRQALKSHGADGFPIVEVEAAMTKLGKSLKFEEDELRELLALQYGDRRTFLALSLLYPGFDFRNEFHLDHVFPQAAFKKKRLIDAGVAADQMAAVAEVRDVLPNLQLLEGPLNSAKSDTMPAEWIKSQYPDKGAREAYLSRHELGAVPEKMTDIVAFIDKRSERMLSNFKKLLGASEVGAKDVK